MKPGKTNECVNGDPRPELAGELQEDLRTRREEIGRAVS